MFSVASMLPRIWVGLRRCPPRRPDRKTARLRLGVEALGERVLPSGTPTLTLTGAPQAAEGTPYALTLGPVANVDPGYAVSSEVVNWGDGTSSTYAAAALAVSHTVYHTYADGHTGASATITVDLQEESFSRDATFHGGKIFKTPNAVDDVITAVADPTSGKFIVLGDVNNVTNLIRFNTDGTVDTTFGSNGLVAFDNAVQVIGGSLAVDAAGNILIGGVVGSGAYQFAVARYRPDGSRDTSFGNNGIATVDLGYTQQFGYGMAIDAQGDIYFTGYVYNGAHEYERVCPPPPDARGPARPRLHARHHPG